MITTGIEMTLDLIRKHTCEDPLKGKKIFFNNKIRTYKFMNKHQ